MSDIDYRFWSGQVLQDAAAGTGTTLESGWFAAQQALGPDQHVYVEPLISMATPTTSTLVLTLEGADRKGDGGVVLHRWVTVGGRNLVAAHLPCRLGAYRGPAFFDYLRMVAVVTGVSAQYSVTAVAQRIPAQPMSGTLFSLQLADGVSVSTSATEVFPVFYTGHLSSYKVKLANRASGQNLTACKFHTYAEEAHSVGSTYEHTFEDTSTFGTVATDAGAELARVDQNDAFIEMNEATVASSTTTVDAWIRGTWR